LEEKLLGGVLFTPPQKFLVKLIVLNPQWLAWSSQLARLRQWDRGARYCCDHARFRRGARTAGQNCIYTASDKVIVLASRRQVAASYAPCMRRHGNRIDRVGSAGVHTRKYDNSAKK
jgi:hypothetical protein